jgi:hypothetical protein
MAFPDDSEIGKNIEAFAPPPAKPPITDNKAKDMAHHLSIESLARRPSPLKEAALHSMLDLIS